MLTVRPLLALRQHVPVPRLTSNSISHLVRAVWLGLFAAVLLYVARYGIQAPYQDEWLFTSFIATSELDWNWVWAAHSEHRYPLGKIVYWCLTTWTHDFRTGAVATACSNA